MTRLLLFDIDGTLLRTGGAGMRAMKRTAAELFGEAFRWDGISAAGHLDPLLVAEAAALNGIADIDAHHDRFRDRYAELLEYELTHNRHLLTVMPGIPPLLEALRRRVAERRDVTLGLLTGNYARTGQMKLRAAAIDPEWFTITAFGDEAGSRPGLVALAMRKHGRGNAVRPRDVIVIGDTERDIACAKAHGCVAFSVATGPLDAEALRRHGPDVVVDNLADPSPLLAWLDGAAA